MCLDIHSHDRDKKNGFGILDIALYNHAMTPTNYITDIFQRGWHSLMDDTVKSYMYIGLTN